MQVFKMEIIDKDLKVELGQLIRVTNLNKKAQENEIYVSLQVEDEDGENERCILFTEAESTDMEKISGSFLESLVCGRIYKCTIGKHQTNIIKVRNFNQETKYFRVSNSQLAKAERRALRNQEDLTKKSLLTDMMD
jgi:hypothetical protein